MCTVLFSCVRAAMLLAHARILPPRLPRAVDQEALSTANTSPLNQFSLSPGDCRRLTTTLGTTAW
jgi:hypothetical protein